MSIIQLNYIYFINCCGSPLRVVGWIAVCNIEKISIIILAYLDSGPLSDSKYLILLSVGYKV